MGPTRRCPGWTTQTERTSVPRKPVFSVPRRPICPTQTTWSARDKNKLCAEQIARHRSARNKKYGLHANRATGLRRAQKSPPWIPAPAPAFWKFGGLGFSFFLALGQLSSFPASAPALRNFQNDSSFSFGFICFCKFVASFLAQKAGKLACWPFLVIIILI